MAINGIESSLNDPKYVRVLEKKVSDLTLHLNSLTKKVDATSRAPRLVRATGDVDISGTALPDGGVNPTRRFTPSAPAGLNAVAVVYFENGLAFTSISIGYERVTNALAGDPITIARHELQGRRVDSEWKTLTSSAGTAVVVNFRPLPTGENWEFRMRAVSAQGVTGPYSELFPFTLPSDTTPPPVPSAPSCTARLGIVSVSWDGLAAGGGGMPTDFARLDVWQSSDNIAFAAIGTIRKAGGASAYMVTDLPYNVVRYFRFTAVDNSGNVSAASASTSVTVKPLVDTDIIGQIIDGAKIKSGSITASDAIIGNTITGALIQALAIKAGNIDANAVTADKIAAGAVVTASMVANTINGDRITGGTVAANKLIANSISTTQLTVGVTQSIIDAQAAGSSALLKESFTTNPVFADWTGAYPNGYSIWSNDRMVKETTLTRTGGAAMRFNISDTTQAGAAMSDSLHAGMANPAFVTLTVDVMLVSGTMGQAGVLIDWRGMTGGTRATLNLYDEIPSPSLGVWYRVSKVLARPANAAGTFTGIAGYLMAQYGSCTGPAGPRDIIYDSLALRASSQEEVAAYYAGDWRTPGLTTINGGMITANTITADQLTATSIDGKTITGAKIRTASSGVRAELSGTSLKFYATGAITDNVTQGASIYAAADSGSITGTAIGFDYQGTQSLLIGKRNLAIGGSATISSDDVVYFPGLRVGAGTDVPITIHGTGSITAAANSGVTATITFPASTFATAPRVIVSFGPSATFFGGSTVSVWSVSATSMVIGVSNTTAGSRVHPFSWIATL